MVFPSPVFLFAFLPVVLALHVVVPRAWRNHLLLLASLVFYGWGEALNGWVLLLSILGNWAIGLWLGRTGHRRLALTVGVIGNLAVLAFFKYLDFLVGIANELGAGPWPLPGVRLPLGISFFTFHALSYLIDVYRGINPPQLGLGRFALYIAFFPQLIAGPIIRYHDVADQLDRREVDAELFASGVERFVLGLAKKVLIANPLGLVADQAFGVPPGGLPGAPAWVGLICYTGQIYFDFSGYSDMAIGLGRMVGFRFLENFNYPYAAQSIQDFWRRWHISLSNWFRDYLYIPLGGSRVAPGRVYANLGIVFLLCGLWHGASVNFVVWGLIHGGFLVVERAGFGRILARLPRPLRHLYVMSVVMLGWVFFRAEGLPAALGYLSSLGGAQGWHWIGVSYITDGLTWIALAAAAVGATPVLARLASDWRMRRAQYSGRGNALAAVFETDEGAAIRLARLVAIGALFVLAVAFVAAGTYNPFIYFRF
jgi:alginate O-acetyltransferase complex protein AlgI